MRLKSLAVVVLLLAACGREETAPDPPAAEAPPAEPAFYVGAWAPDPSTCSKPWTITETSLATPGTVRCDFQSVTPTGGMVEVEAVCTAQGAPEPHRMTFAYAQSAGALLIGDGPFGDQGLVRCDGPAEAPAPGTPGGLPDNRTPVSEAPFTPDSAQGAANVLQSYYALMASKRYEEAWRLWSPGSEARQRSAADFARSYADFDSYNANIGAPGRIEGAAGSLYVAVPVQVYARRKDGRPVNLIGSATLRRANDVPGATPEQLAWRIQSIAVAAPGA